MKYKLFGLCVSVLGSIVIAEVNLPQPQSVLSHERESTLYAHRRTQAQGPYVVPEDAIVSESRYPEVQTLPLGSTDETRETFMTNCAGKVQEYYLKLVAKERDKFEEKCERVIATADAVYTAHPNYARTSINVSLILQCVERTDEEVALKSRYNLCSRINKKIESLAENTSDEVEFEKHFKRYELLGCQEMLMKKQSELPPKTQFSKASVLGCENKK